jgi:hypothetical protein
MFHVQDSSNSYLLYKSDLLLLFTILLTSNFLSLFYIIGYAVFRSECNSVLSSSKTLERYSIYLAEYLLCVACKVFQLAVPLSM